MTSWFLGSIAPSTCHLSLLYYNRMVPQHTHSIEGNISCKSKISPFGRRTCDRHSRQTPTHWTTPSRRILMLRHTMFVTQTLPPPPQNIHWLGMDGSVQGLHYQKLQGFQTSSWGYHRFGWWLYWIKLNNKNRLSMSKSISYSVCTGRLWGI